MVLLKDVPPYDEFVCAWKALRGKNALSVREVACVAANRTLLVAEIAVPNTPVVALAAGVHGDEPAAPWALLSIVRDGLLEPTFSYRLWPCTNPSGYMAGTRSNAEGVDVNRSFDRGGTTPEARAIITANRDRRFALSLDLHEDYEASGFYCYEPKTQPGRLLGPAIVEALTEAGHALQAFSAGYDLGYASEAREHLFCEPGRVVYDPTQDLAQFSGMPYSVYMFRRAAQRVMTFESAGSLCWEDRIAMHRVAVLTALNELKALFRSRSLTVS
jgi:murein peptide amidase A